MKSFYNKYIPYSIRTKIGKSRDEISNFFLMFIFINKKFSKRGYHQISNTTKLDRYPEIFSSASFLIGNKSNDCQILSFGCSYGLECFTLRKYLKSAIIIGYDINENNIKQAKLNNSDDGIQFYSKLNKIYKTEFYDAVFAMSVLCRWPGTKNVEDCSKIYSFEQFNEQVELLDKIIKNEGYLIIYNSNFKFTDTKISHRYEKICIPNLSDSGFVLKFSMKNKRLKNQNYSYSIFRKR